MKKKLDLQELKVQSFVTTFQGNKAETAKAGNLAVVEQPIAVISDGDAHCATPLHGSCVPDFSCGGSYCLWCKILTV